MREFASYREHTITLAERCRSCHEEEAQDYSDSVHFALLEKGISMAPVCTDCHGFHSVKEAETMAQLAGLPCQNCHSLVFNAFKGSRHGRGGEDGHFNVPLCSDCHQAHAVRPAYWNGQVRSTCLSCHEGVQELHGRWLPNAGIHLETASCPSCHAPQAERGIDLVLSGDNLEGGFSRGQIDEILGEAGAAGGELDSMELWSLLRRARRSGVGENIALEGRMLIRTGIDAHSLAAGGTALRTCESCHIPGSRAFDSLTLTIVADDGRPVRVSASGEVLSSLSSVDSLKNFYLLAGTRLKILDLLLVLAVLGGMSVPALHMTARLLAERSAGGEKP